MNSLRTTAIISVAVAPFLHKFLKPFQGIDGLLVPYWPNGEVAVT